MLAKGETAINGTTILIDLLGGVALLLWAVRMVRTGVSRAFGAALHRALAAATGNRLAAFGVGLGLTSLLQSSAATALMTASFAGRGLIAVPAALALMLGADVGTTLIAQILSFKPLWVSPLLIAAGVIAFMTTESSRVRHLGRVAIGLGLLLLSLRLIVDASTPLREASTLPVVLAPLSAEPLLALIVAALITWLAHSSLAVVLLVMSLAATGVVPPALAFGLVLGANVGGAIAPVVMTAGAERLARRIPLGNLLMRIAGALAAIPLLPLAADWIALAGADPARQVANAHTGFNLALALVFLPLVDLVAALCRRLLPERPRADDPGTPRHLEPEALASPPLALACAARETLRMGDVVESMLRRSIDVFLKNDERLGKEVEADDDTVDRLHEAIKLYLTRVSQEALDHSEGRRYVEILTFTTNLEHVGDIIDKNLMELAAKKIRNRLSFSPDGLKEICDFHARVMDHMRLALTVFISRDLRLARQLIAEKTDVRQAELMAAESHFGRVSAGRPDSIETSSLHLDIIRDLKRINGHLTSVAYPILEDAGELRTSRLKQPDAAPSGAGLEERPAP